MARLIRPLSVSPTMLAVAMVALAAATEIKLRTRDASLALQASLDAQIVAELAVWGFVFAALFAVALRRRRGGVLTPFLPVSLPPALRIMSVIAVIAVVWSFRAPTTLSIVRSFQFAAMTALAIATFRRLQSDTEATAEYWITMRRAIWFVVVAAVLGTIAVNGLSVPAFEGEFRYAWFRMHPISTGTIMGLGLILAVGAVFQLREPLLARRWFVIAASGLAGVISLLLLLTKARGALAATALGVAVVVILSRRKQMRLAAVLIGICGVAVVLAGIGDEALFGALRRGATDTELRTLTGRTELFRIAFDLFLAEPVIGYGFLAGRSVFLEAVPWAGHAHNLLAEIAISFGAVGLLIYGALALRVLNEQRVSRRRRTSPESMMLWETAGLLAFIAISGVVGSGAASIPGFEFMALLVAALAADVWSARPGHDVVETPPALPLTQPERVDTRRPAARSRARR